MSKPTPGPWKVDAGETYNVRDAATEGVVCQIHFLRGRHGLAGRIPAEQGLANAHLIAAVPELLEAAKRALRVFKAQGDAVLPTNVLGALDSAIAKAEGRR